MKRSLLILEEILLGIGVALAISSLFSSQFISYLDPVASPATVFLGAVYFVPVGLIFVWLHTWLLVRSAAFFKTELTRRQAVGRLRPFYLCYLVLVLPIFTFTSIAIPLLLVLTLFIWRRHLTRPGIRGGASRWMESLEIRARTFGIIKTSWVVAGLLGVFYILISIGSFADLPQPAGDEPHYLTFSYSLVTDGDFQMFNNYQERHYDLWHSGWIQSHTKAGKEGIEQQYPMHNTGLAMLLSPAMALALVFKTTFAVHFFTRLTIVLITTAFLAVLLQVLFRLYNNLVLATGVTVLTGLTAPALFFSYHIFTEMPVALLSLFIFSVLLRKVAPGLLLRCCAGLALGFLAFMSVKYILIAASLSLLWLIREFHWGFSLSRLLTVGLIGATVLGLFLFQTWHFFGTIDPAAYYVGAEGNLFGKTYLMKASHGENLFESLTVTAETALSFFVGQREALLFYSPWFLLGIAGLISMARDPSQRFTLLALLVIVVPFLLVYGATGFGGGHSPPARAITAIIWVFVIPVAAWFNRRSGHMHEISFALISISLVVSLVLLLNPGFLYHDFPVEAGHVANWLSTPSLDLTHAMPSVNNKHFENWPVVALWIAIYAGIAVIALQAKQPQQGRHRFAGISMLVALVMVVIYALLAATPPTDATVYEQEQPSLTVHFENDNYFVEDFGFWIRSRSREVIYIASPQPLTGIRINLRSPAQNEVIIESGDYSRQLHFFDKRRHRFVLPLDTGVHRNGKHIYRVSIESLMGRSPALQQGGDKRPLGVEVKVLPPLANPGRSS